MNFLLAIVGVVAALGPLIILHEFGHYWVARRCGVRVLRFSIGFGRPLVKWQRAPGETEWVLAAIPFGGFVAMLDEREVEEGTVPEAELRHAFNRQPVYKRMAIVAAGPLANFIVAILVYWGINLHGIEEPRARLGAPPPQTLAAAAGVQAGDDVIALNGEPVRSFVDLRWRLVKLAVDHGAASLDVRHRNADHDTVKLDLSGVKEGDLGVDLMRQLGLVPLSPPAVIESVDPGPAKEAGVMAGDRIVAVDAAPIATAADLEKAIVGRSGEPLELTVERAGRAMQIRVTPAAVEDPQDPTRHIGRINVHLPVPESVTVEYGPFEALARAGAQTWDMSTFTLHLVGKMVTGQLSLKNLSGPVTIADYAGQAVRQGFLDFFSYVAFISISLGIMNLLPVPMLDGGHLMYYFAEIIMRRPPSERFLELSQRAGMIVLACLVSLALFNDFSRHIPRLPF